MADSPTIMEAGAKDIVDLSIIDAAYGADPDEQLVKLQQLESAICNTLQKGGSVLLPVPIHGRSQELIVWASECFPDDQLIVEEELIAPLRGLSDKTEWLKEGAIQRVDMLF